MPYIKNERRLELQDHYDPEFGCFPDKARDLNYIITLVCLEYLKNNGTNYQNINDIVGALECAKLEFYRRLVVPYETKKITENGDVY